MTVDLCTLTLLIGIIAGAIFYLHGWGPSPGIRGLESRPGARGVVLVMGTGGVVLLLDLLLYHTPGYAYFTSYLLGLAYGWLGLLAASAVLHILWGLGRLRSKERPSGLARVSHLVLEALALAAPEQPATQASSASIEEPFESAGVPLDELSRVGERLKREDPSGYLDFERLRIEAAQRDLEMQRGNLERLWQEFARVRAQPEKTAAEVIAQKQQMIGALQDELAKARRFYTTEPEKLQATLAGYDRLLGQQEQVRDELQSMLVDLENHRVSRDDLVRVVLYQKLAQHTGGGNIVVGKLAIGEGQILVHHGEITSIAADAIVSSDNNYLTMSDGVARRIRDRGGEEIYLEARRLIPMKRGDVGITPAGRLTARKVFHAVVLDFDEREGPTEEVIRELVRNGMHKARELGFRRIAFPVLGAGSGGFPAAAAFRTMLEQLSREMVNGKNTVAEAILCVSGPLAEMIDVSRAIREVEEDVRE